MPRFDLIAILSMVAVVASAIIAGSLFPSGKSSVVTVSTVGTNSGTGVLTKRDGVGAGVDAINNMTGMNMTSFGSRP